MKTTDLQPILDAVRNIQINELRQALLAHGGSFDFMEGNSTEIVSVEFYSEGGGPSSGLVVQAAVRYPETESGDSGKPEVVLTIDDDYYDEYEIPAENVYPGHLSTVTEALPEPVGKKS